MRLATLQEALGTLLLQPEGLSALVDDEAWQAYLARSPHREVLADYPRDRLALYEELLYNTFEGSMAGFFPITKLFIEAEWTDLLEEYRRAYPNSSFYMHPCARAFPDFLSQQSTLMAQYPFLVDLARYEQLEVEVYNDPDTPLPEAFQAGIPQDVKHFSQWAPVWNSVMYLHAFDYPIPSLIEAINATEDFDPTAFEAIPASTHILIYRDPETFDSRFFILNALTAKVVQSASLPLSYLALFRYLQQEEPMLQGIAEPVLLQEGLKLIHSCFQQKIIVGSIPTSS